MVSIFLAIKYWKLRYVLLPYIMLLYFIRLQYSINITFICIEKQKNSYNLLYFVIFIWLGLSGTKCRISFSSACTHTWATYVHTTTCWCAENGPSVLYGLGFKIRYKMSWETCIQVKKQELEPDMEQQTG